MLLIIGIILIIWFCVHVSKENDKAREIILQRDIEKAKKITEQRINFKLKLISSKLPDTVSAMLSKMVESEIDKRIYEHIHKYNYRPASVDVIYKDYFFEIDSKRVLPRGLFGNEVIFQKLGYCDLNSPVEVQAFSEIMVSPKYGKWEISSDGIRTDRTYWKKYTQQRIFYICTIKNIPSLKKI